MPAGKEHPQIEAIARLFAGDATPPPAPDLMTPDGTPNQHALGCAVRLAWERLRPDGTPATRQAAAQQALDLLVLMQRVGHQAVAPGYGDEQGCPDPHSGLWMGAMATILREARIQSIGSVLPLAMAYFADHLALCRAFWTPAGVRMPCSRAKASPPRPLAPNWSVDSWAYAEMMGIPTAALAKPDRLTLDILRDSRTLWPAIVTASRAAQPRLAIPVLKWNLAGGGFAAALDHDVAMNDRMSWVVVDVLGEIKAASNTLDNFNRPDGAPTAVGGEASPASGGALRPPDPPDPVTAATLPDLADRVAHLGLANRDKGVQGTVVARLRSGHASPGDLREMADQVAAFGIGEGQAQAGAWHAVVADLRRLAGAPPIDEHPPPATVVAAPPSSTPTPPASPALPAPSAPARSPMPKIADAIVNYASRYPELHLLATETLSYQVPGVAQARDKIRGTFNPASRPFDYQTTRADLAAVFVERYGRGFGLPYKTSPDPQEGGYQPDADNRNYGWELEEDLPLPLPATLKALGLPPDYRLDGMDRTDLQACVNFTLLVVRPLNTGQPIGRPVVASTPPLPRGSDAQPPAPLAPAPAGPTPALQPDTAAALQQAAVLHAVIALVTLLLGQQGGSAAALAPSLTGLLAGGSPSTAIDPTSALLALLPALLQQKSQ